MRRSSHGNTIKLGRSFWLEHPLGSCVLGTAVAIVAIYALTALGVM